MENDPAHIAAYVDATAALLRLPVDASRRAAVIATMQRLAAFSADVAAVELPPEIELAGVFVP